MKPTAPALGTSIIAALWLLAFFPNNAAPRMDAAIAAGAACLVLAFGISRDRTARQILPGLTLLTLAIPLSITLGTLAAGDLSELLPFAVVALPFALTALASARLDAVQQRRVLWGVFWLGMVEGTIGLSQKLFGVPVSWGWLGEVGSATLLGNALWEGARVPATMGHGIPLGVLVAAAIIIVLCQPGRPAIPVRLAAATYLFLTLLATGSRSTLIVGAAVMGFAIYTQRVRIRTATTQILFTFAVLVSLIYVDYRTLPVIASLDGSASLTNRQDSWALFPRLSSRPIIESLFGSGWDGVRRLREAGVLPNSNYAIDNTALVLGGWLALIAILLLAVFAVRRSSPTGRVLMLFLVGMFLSFDVVAWSFPLALLALVAGMARVAVPATSARHQAASAARFQPVDVLT